MELKNIFYKSNECLYRVINRFMEITKLWTGILVWN